MTKPTTVEGFIDQANARHEARKLVYPSAQDVENAYDRFRLALFDGFDETSGKSLREMAQRAENTNACFLAGEPDIVPQPLEDATLDLKRILRQAKPTKIDQVAKDLLLFRSFLRSKQIAFKHRLEGNIAKAFAFEQTAEWAYGQLSLDFKW